MTLAEHLGACYAREIGQGAGNPHARLMAELAQDPELKAAAERRLADIEALAATLPGGVEDLHKRDHIASVHRRILRTALAAQ